MRALDCAVSAFRVINAKGNAVRISKIEFVQICLQVTFSAVLIDTGHTALEDTEEPFDRVCRHVAASILADLNDRLALPYSEFLAQGLAAFAARGQFRLWGALLATA